jgi:hypothetical protein
MRIRQAALFSLRIFRQKRAMFPVKNAWWLLFLQSGGTASPVPGLVSMSSSVHEHRDAEAEVGHPFDNVQTSRQEPETHGSRDEALTSEDLSEAVSEAAPQPDAEAVDHGHDGVPVDQQAAPAPALRNGLSLTAEEVCAATRRKYLSALTASESPIEY